jgi:hypothetical protein
MRKAFFGSLILLLVMILFLVTAQVDAGRVEGKWHGPGGVIYLHAQGHLITHGMEIPISQLIFLVMQPGLRQNGMDQEV